MRVFTDAERCAPVNVRGTAVDAGVILPSVRAVVALTSARGGAGKSALVVNLAAALAGAGRKIGILDADLNSPSIRSMLGIRAPRRPPVSEGLEPIAAPFGIRVASVDLLPDLTSAPPSFAEWAEAPRMPEAGGRALVEVAYSLAVRRLFEQTRWGALDLILIDLPPGLEALSRLLTILPQARLVIVTHPSELAAQAARAVGELAADKSAAVIGVIENMAGFSCENCHSVRPLMPQGAVAPLAHDLGLSLLERLPFDPHFAEMTDRGRLFVREYSDTPLAKQIEAIAQTIDHASRVDRALQAPVS